MTLLLNLQEIIILSLVSGQRAINNKVRSFSGHCNRQSVDDVFKHILGERESVLLWPIQHLSVPCSKAEIKFLYMSKLVTISNRLVT